MKNIEGIDLKELLARYVPIIQTFLGDEYEKMGWSNLNKKYADEIQKRKEKLAANENYLEVFSNFYDILFASIEGKREANNLLDLFQYVMDELCDSVPVNMKAEIRTIVKNLLISFDHNYLNYVGELAALNSITRKGTAKLIKVEFRLDNGKEVDFLITNNEGETYQVEVVNINLFVHNKNGHNNTTFESHINRILIEKVNAKTHRLAEISNFIVVPVIWAEHTDLTQIGFLYKDPIWVKVPKTFEPQAFCTFFDSKTNEPEYRFGKITTLFDAEPLSPNK